MSSQVETSLSPHIIELAAQCLEASPDDVTITRVAGDASTRVYFRASALSDTGRSAIVTLYKQPFDERLSALERLHAAEAETPAARLTFASDPCAQIETTAI